MMTDIYLGVLSASVLATLCMQLVNFFRYGSIHQTIQEAAAATLKIEIATNSMMAEARKAAEIASYAKGVADTLAKAAQIIDAKPETNG